MLLSRRCHTQGDMDAGAAGVVLPQSEGSANGRIETAVKVPVSSVICRIGLLGVHERHALRVRRGVAARRLFEPEPVDAQRLDPLHVAG